MRSYLIACVVTILTPVLARAQGVPGAGGAGAPAALNFVFIGGMFLIMYFFMIRPQMKKQKMHQEFLQKLKRGDEVLTSGGVLGRIEGLTDLFVTLEIAPGVRIKVVRTQISSFVPTANAATNEVKA